MREGLAARARDRGDVSTIVWLDPPVPLSEGVDRTAWPAVRPSMVVGYDRAVSAPAWLAERLRAE